MGDIVHGLQVVQSLREQVSGCRISWVVRDIFAPLVNICSTVDETIIYQRHGGWRKFIGLLKEIRSREYDAVIDLQGLARSGLMTYFSRSKHKLGRSDAREFAHFAYSKKASLPVGGRNAHAIEILLQFLPLLNCEPQLKGKLQFKNINMINIPQKLLEENPILLFPESRRAEKEWGGFNSLAEVLLKEKDDRIIIFCGSSKGDTPTTVLNDRCYNIRGDTRIDELALLISKAALIVANDSGPIHLAAALGIPLVGLYGPTPPERFGPYPLDYPGHHLVQAPEGNLKKVGVNVVCETVLKALRQ